MVTPIDSTVAIEDPFEIECACPRSVAVECPLAGAPTDRSSLAAVDVQRRERVFGGGGDEYLATRFEELIETLPFV
jgi:hypothetical protein